MNHVENLYFFLATAMLCSEARDSNLIQSFEINFQPIAINNAWSESLCHQLLTSKIKLLIIAANKSSSRLPIIKPSYFHNQGNKLKDRTLSKIFLFSFMIPGSKSIFFIMHSTDCSKQSLQWGVIQTHV